MRAVGHPGDKRALACKGHVRLKAGAGRAGLPPGASATLQVGAPALPSCGSITLASVLRDFSL